ncbi:LysR family transcriptional regulator [Nocardioides sp.]|uniref:LysR family transcriptional regulator n=1 Tax=Nocardioides sp. TaxID=35761 RepID=UPI002634FBA2|nr:LysR family transcriptional regulator [Nocardioides sp.]
MAVDLRRIDLNLLVALEAVLDEQNLTRAAERIGTTQPAMSSTLTRLRRVTGDELLIRVGRGFVLSPVAEELLPLVHEAVAQVRRTLEASRAFDPATSTRRFRISTSDYAMFVIGAALEQRLTALAPGVEVDFDTIPSDDLGHHLMRRDLIIGGARRGIPGQRMTVFRDEFVCVVSEHGPVTSEKLSLQEMGDLPYLSASFGSGVLTPADDALAMAGVTPQRRVQAPGLLAIPFLLSGTDLFAFVPARIAQQMGPELGLRTVTTPLQMAPLVEAAHWHPHTADEAGLVWLLDVVREVGVQVRGEAATA